MGVSLSLRKSSKEPPRKAAPQSENFARHLAGGNTMAWICADLLNRVEQNAIHLNLDRVFKV
ncbi:hypothetical protein [Roseobacter cerasinus]|uniref:hypothetical protein n=1 Tax=Roseobacter cerasinus TaxID=2602289 RepID=UPI001357A290|nr:hypothetical protein [Roseobacter cerasinus]